MSNYIMTDNNENVKRQKGTMDSLNWISRQIDEVLAAPNISPMAKRDFIHDTYIDVAELARTLAMGGAQ